MKTIPASWEFSRSAIERELLRAGQFAHVSAQDVSDTLSEILECCPKWFGAGRPKYKPRYSRPVIVISGKYKHETKMSGDPFYCFGRPACKGKPLEVIAWTFSPEETFSLFAAKFGCLCQVCLRPEAKFRRYAELPSHILIGNREHEYVCVCEWCFDRDLHVLRDDFCFGEYDLKRLAQFSNKRFRETFFDRAIEAKMKWPLRFNPRTKVDPDFYYTFRGIDELFNEAH